LDEIAQIMYLNKKEEDWYTVLFFFRNITHTLEGWGHYKRS
jgi:hypothetical protein